MADEGSVVASACATSKSIPQSMIDNVLAVCPDVDPKDVAKDLVITGSATRTINRILDGQFPAAVNVDFESMPSEISSEDEVRGPYKVTSPHSKNLSVSANKVLPVINHDDNSSDTEKYTVDTDDDDDDDDDITILNEESKSLFSALKKRMHSTKQSEHKYAKQTKTLDLHKDNRIINNNYELESSPQKRPVNTKRTSSIVDLSFSDDDSSFEKISHKEHSPLAMNRTVNCAMKEPTGASHRIKSVNKLRNGSKQGTNSLDSRLHGSDNDTDSCEGSDGFPCILASSRLLYSETTSRSATADLTSGSCLDSQDSSGIPFKRKKRSKEEIMSQRNEALRKKQAKELERLAKKEAKEREKQERQQAKELMKTQKEREKLLKKADSMNKKMNNRLDNCIQQIKVCIDPEIVNGGQLPEESLLLQKLESFGARHKVESQLIPASITWKRAVVEHDVADTLQISTKTSFVDEKHLLVRLTADKFVEMVFHFREEMQNPAISVIADDETLSAFCERTLAIYPGRVVTLVIVGLEKYFRDVKLTQTRQFRSAVLGSSSSDNEKPSSSKGRKKVNKKSGPSVMVSRVDVEEALVDLQLRQPNCRVRMCETEEEFAELLAMFTKAVGEAPFKFLGGEDTLKTIMSYFLKTKCEDDPETINVKKQPETFSFCVEGGEKASVKVSKEGEGLKKVWLQQFQQFRNVSADMAAAIVAVYPTPQSLLQAYRRCDSRVESTKLLQDILVRRGAGVLANSRRIGPELSRRVFLLLTSEDGDLPVK